MVEDYSSITRSHAFRLLRPWRTAARYVWALPNTIVGLLFVAAALPAGGIQLVDGVLEVYGPVIAWILRRAVPVRGGAAAITFGHIVVGRNRALLEQTRLHERVHVRQCERWGPAFIPAYIVASASAWLTGKGVYDGNCFEVEARRVEESAWYSSRPLLS